MSNVEAREVEPLLDQTKDVRTAVRRRWPRVVVLAIVGAVLGAVAGMIVPASYTAETRVAVGQGSLTSSAIAGFPLAAMDLASNYARYVNSTGVARQSTMPGVVLKASQIPESNVIRIEATSRNAQDAAAAAKAAADDLVSQVNDEATQRAVEETRTAVSQASAGYGDAFARVQTASAEVIRVQSPPIASAADREGAQRRLAEAKAAEGITEAELRAQQAKLTRLISEDSEAAKLTVVRDVGEPESNRSSHIQLFLLLGALVGAAVGLVAVTVTGRPKKPAGN